MPPPPPYDGASVDCVRDWSTCTTACEQALDRTWNETVAQQGAGAACPDAQDCVEGEGECCVDDDTAVLSMGYTCAQIATGGACAYIEQLGPVCGCSCPVSLCSDDDSSMVAATGYTCAQIAGAGACGQVTGIPQIRCLCTCSCPNDACKPAPVNCTGEWSPCTEACEAGAHRAWTQTTPPESGGTPCPAAAPNCREGDGACRSVNCAGEWSECTDACEVAGGRTWTQTAAPEGGGAPCPRPRDCREGEGGCPVPPPPPFDGPPCPSYAFWVFSGVFSVSCLWFVLNPVNLSGQGPGPRGVERNHRSLCPSRRVCSAARFHR